MNRRDRRSRLAGVLALALAATALHADAAAVRGEPRSRTGRAEVTVVVVGTVSWVEPPQRLGLEGGWTVELADATPWLDELASQVAQGDHPRVKVVGRRTPGSADRLVRAGGVEVVVDASLAGSAAGSPGWRRAEAAGGRGAVVPEIEDDETTLRGFILGFTTDGFEMVAEGSVYEVVVTDQTELEGFGDLSELEVGNEVEVRGLLQGATIIASRVKLRSSGEETRLRGAIVAFMPDGLEMDSGGTVFEVVVTGQTELHNFGSLDELAIGDEIEARGTLAGLVLTATRLELLEGGIDFEFSGLLTMLLPPDRFVMDDGRIYTVDPSTFFDPALGGYSGLAVGQYLEVKARRGPSGSNLVVEVEYEGDMQSGQGYRELDGVVLSIGATELQLEGGATATITPSTEFKGDADSWQDVVPGWWAEVYVLLDDLGMLTALEVRTDDRESATTGGQDFEPQQALVVPVPGASVDAIAARFGAQVVGRVGGLGALLWFPEELSDDLLAALTADPEVAAVEPNYHFQDPESVRRRYPTVDRTPTSEKLVGQPAVHQVKLPAAQQLADGGGVVVAVIDTGVDPLHPALRRKLLPGGLDLVDGDLSPWEERDQVDNDGDGDVDEAAGHGTFVASLVGLAAPAATILPYRVLDDEGAGTAYNLALAVADAIERRVDVINLSLVYRERSSAVDLLLERAGELGIVVVASAGNDASTVVPFPASDSNVLAVAAIGEDGLSLAPFTNRSHLVHLAAPGETVYGALDEQSFGTWSGSSMAAPFVAGTAALLLSADPGLDPLLVRNALEQSGVAVTDGDWTGTMLDAYAALALVQAP